MKKTIVINILGGPGVGKTTIANELFIRLKKLGKDVEAVSEFAKELVWEKRSEAFDDRLYMHAEQNHRLMMMNNNLDYIITDSPLILTSIYNNYYLKNKFSKKYNAMIDEMSIQTWNLYNNITFYIERKADYNNVGRRESQKQAIDIDLKIKKYLKDHNIEYIKIKDRDNAVDEILNNIL